MFRKFRFWAVAACIIAGVCMAFGNHIDLGAGAVLAAAPVFTDDEMIQLRGLFGELRGGWAEMKQMVQKYHQLTAECDQMKLALNTLRRAQLGRSIIAPKRANEAVSADCAKFLGSLFVIAAKEQGRFDKLPEKLFDDAQDLIKRELSGVIAQKSTLTTTDIPLPVIYAKEVVELVWMYGQARKYCSVVPLGAGTVKLPKLKTSPAFGFINAAAAIGEKSPQIEFVDFVAKKAGGIVRFPSEIDVDSLEVLGQFLGRYCAREMAKWEDTVTFIADGSGTYLSLKGVGKYAVDGGYKYQLATGNTDAGDITVAHCRSLRAVVDGAALQNGAYYMHPSMESLLSKFNTSGNEPYQAFTPDGPKLDGFPVRWVGVMPIYDEVAHVNQVQMLFGDLSFWYFGIRSDLDVRSSEHVYWTTDEIVLRALQRFDVHAMADPAMGALQLAAS